MARGAEVVQALARAAGLLPATVRRAFRVLQVAGGDRVPLGRVGSGPYQTPPMQIRHVRNLLLALSASPITAAAAWVDELAAMEVRIVRTVGVGLSDPPDSHEFPLGELAVARTFGRAVDLVLEQAASPDGPRLMERVDIEISVEGESVMGSIRLFDAGQVRHGAYYRSPGRSERERMVERERHDGPWYAGLVRTTRFHGNLIHAAGATLATPAPTKSAAAPWQGSGGASCDRPPVEAIARATPQPKVRNLDSPEPGTGVGVGASPRGRNGRSLRRASSRGTPAHDKHEPEPP